MGRNDFTGFERDVYDLLKFFGAVTPEQQAAERAKTCECRSLLSRVEDNKEDFKIYVEAAGVTKDQIDVEYKDNFVFLKVNFGEESALRTQTYHGKWKFKGVDETKIDAKLEAGILTIVLPKKPEEQPVKVNIS